jgi:hypothetical protein
MTRPKVTPHMTASPRTASRSDFLTMTLDQMELAFIEDFIQFAARISLSASLAQLSNRSRAGAERKRLAAGILQQLFTSLEDFAVLLTSMIKRKSGAHLHLAMSFAESQGTTQYPAILKKPVMAKDLFVALGFTNVTVEKLRRIGYEVTEEDLDASFRDFALSVKQLGEYVDAFNQPKNRLKHGKAIFGIAFDLDATDDIGHLEYDKQRQSLGLAKTSASDDQVALAVVFIGKLAKMSLDLLALFVAHYHSEEQAEQIAYLVKDQFDEIVMSVKAAGISSKGLTH